VGLFTLIFTLPPLPFSSGCAFPSRFLGGARQLAGVCDVIGGRLMNSKNRMLYFHVKP
jgi:hypothetical protein